MSFNQTWRETPTKLFLNGPALSFTTEPSTITLDAGGSGTFVGLATVSFTASNPGADLDGAISYQWYRKLASETSFSALGSGGTFHSGETTRILSIDYALSPDVHNSKYYLQATYTPVGLADTALTGGDAVPEPVITAEATLFTNPALGIAAQPSDQTAVVNSNATFTVTPTVSDTSQGSVTYQWSLNGSAVTNGTTQTTSTLATNSNKYSYSNTSSGRLDITIPDNATDVRIDISGGRGGSGGTYLNGTGGAGGYGRRATFNLPDGGRDLQLYIGTAGARPAGGGHQGSYPFIRAGNGGTGNSDGGGGGSGSFVYDATLGGYIIAAGGGGGGGGGAQNSGTSNSGSNAGAFSELSDFAANMTANAQGEEGQSTSNGGGGGGGGSGYVGGPRGLAGANIAPPPPKPAPPQPPPQPPQPPPPQPPPQPPPPPPPRRRRRRRRRRGKIICKNLAALGYFKDKEMNDADQRFAVWLKKNDPVAYDGYIVWARTVVDLMDGGGPESFRKITFFWERDDAKRIYLQQKLVCYYMDGLARPWAEEMAHRMGAKGYEKSNPAGNLMMKIGIPLCRWVGRAKSDKKMNQTLKVFLIWKIVTILLLSTGTISAFDSLLNKIKGLFK